MEKHVLVVEDEQDIREAVSEALTDAGFTVTPATNGAEGLKLALEKKPDLILLDIVMPEMNGHEMLKKLREDKWGQDAKVIMLTSMDNTQNVAEAYEGDITDYVIKIHNSLDEIVKKVRLAIHSDE